MSMLFLLINEKLYSKFDTKIRKFYLIKIDEVLYYLIYNAFQIVLVSVMLNSNENM